MHGTGEYHWRDGVIYSGEFRSSHPTGSGRLTWFVDCFIVLVGNDLLLNLAS
jgi:hypothetical protein